MVKITEWWIANYIYSTPVGGGKTTSFLLLLVAYVIESERFGFDKRIRDQTISTKSYSEDIPMCGFFFFQYKVITQLWLIGTI